MQQLCLVPFQLFFLHIQLFSACCILSFTDFSNIRFLSSLFFLIVSSGRGLSKEGQPCGRNNSVKNDSAH